MFAIYHHAVLRYLCASLKSAFTVVIRRGMGRQAQLVCCNVAGFWVIGTLTGYVLAFNAHLGVSGLWLGINAGVFSCGELLFCVVPYMYSILPLHLLLPHEFGSHPSTAAQIVCTARWPEQRLLSHQLGLSKVPAAGFLE